VTSTQLEERSRGGGGQPRGHPGPAAPRARRAGGAARPSARLPTSAAPRCMLQ